jgi:CRISPR-associated exonuclease Cas4
MYTEDDLLPLSALADLAFCERRAALHHIEQVWEDNLFTVEGTLMHQKVDSVDPTEARGDLRIARGLRLRSLRLGLTAKLDVVEFHRLPEDAPGLVLGNVPGHWRPFPVEYKRGKLRHERGFEVQLCAQAMCLEEMLNVPVPCGAIFYGKTARRLEVAFDAELRAQTESAAQRLHALFDAGVTPQAAYENKCDSCSLMSRCMPKATSGERSARDYLLRATET